MGVRELALIICRYIVLTQGQLTIMLRYVPTKPSFVHHVFSPDITYHHG